MISYSGNSYSRNRFLRTAGLLTAGYFLKLDKLYAQTSPVITIKTAAASTPIAVQKLRGDIYVLSGSGGNISVFNSRDGKVMVDAGIAVSRPGIIDALNKIGSAPVKYLINSHWHFDHTDGNEWIHAAGAKIIAHQQTKKNLETTIKVVDWDYTFTPAPPGALPSLVFDTEYVLHHDGKDIQMKKYAPAHTNCDISIYYPHADVLHVADTWWNPYYPFIDHNSGGSLDGMINACQRNISLATDKTIIIPGHGAVGNRSQLMEFRDMLVAIRHNVSRLKKAGRSLADTIAARPTKAFDEKWGKYVVHAPLFTRLVYADV